MPRDSAALRESPSGVGGLEEYEAFEPVEHELAPELTPVTFEPPNAEAPVTALQSFLTPASLRFVRCHFSVPELDPAVHALEVCGALARPLRLSLGELRALPQRSVTVTTECAGNSRISIAPLPSGEPWEGGAVATGQWTGVSLRTVLEQVGLSAEVVEIAFTGADRGKLPGGEQANYQRSLPLAAALDEDVLIALELNGAPLRAAHGAPLRLVVPGWYGMASVKWLASIEARTEPLGTFFQTERYRFRGGATDEPVLRMRVKSLIVSPAEGAVVSCEPLSVRGFAWSGSAPIARVEVAVGGGEVAVGGGEEWRLARLLGPALPHAWRSWEFSWTPPAPGRHVLRSRATDALGATQPARPAWNELGYGANAIPQIWVLAT